MTGIEGGILSDQVTPSGLSSAAPQTGDCLHDLSGPGHFADHYVVPIRIAQCELSGTGVCIDNRLLLEEGDKCVGTPQCLIKIADAEKQQQAIARARKIGAEKGRMLMRSPLVQAEQDSAVMIQNLAEIIVGRL